MAEGFTPIEMFCCYAREDETWLRKLETHLSLLKRQALISLWYDRLILPGANWAKALDTHLETASVILLLVSSDFFASDYSYGIEMKRALEREAAGEARVIPILVRPVDWKGAPFAHLQALPTDAKAITSWQNKDTALADVAAGIRRVIVEDLPQLTASAPRAALPKIWNVPYPRNPFFLGRESELLRIRQNLQTGQATALSQPQAISGLGGIGKTQLALEYAYRYHQDYTAVLWARAESTDALISSYVTFATLLQLPEHEAKEQEVTVQAVKTWLQTHRDWLLILDNADELTLLPDFLPPSLGGHLLLTTRAAATGRLAHRLELDTLLPEQGALFLLRRAALIEPFAELVQASQGEQELAIHISQQFGGLLLALDQAGAYLEETGTDLIGYWQIYQQQRANLLQERRKLVADHPDSVATTWSLSFQSVEQKNAAAAELLCLCAFLAPDAIPEEILMEGASSLGPVLALVATDAFQRNQAIEALRAYSLIKRDPKGKTLSIHRLVQAVLQDRLSEEERRIWRERAMLAVNAAFPRPTSGNLLQCERMLSQALFTGQSIEQDQFRGKEAGHLLQKTALYLTVGWRLEEAEPLYRRALLILEQQLGPEHLDVAQLLTDMASFYSRPGSPFVKVGPFYQRALPILEQHLGPEHPDVDHVLLMLAIEYRFDHKYEEAESFYQRVLHIWEQQKGPEHPVVANLLNDLAELYLLQGKYEEAEPLFQRALPILEQHLGLEHVRVITLLSYLAFLSSRLGKYEKAELFRQLLLHIEEQQNGPEHPDVARSLNTLAALYCEQGKYAEAEPLLQRALSILEQQKGPADFETAETMHDLAQLREVQGNCEEARAWYARALAIREQALGAHHPNTTETRTRLIALLHAMGLHEQAAQLEAAQSEP
ncbi:MAG: toll/interleukin-1 receptor domain-containing protein [Ktedonobacteraceae bacterium]|nr:toll/interleukin-1 receptor domain-containing protein [Ktedonobacteraceae bacterium]